jgi:excisionase family DNA binding protein
VPRTREPILYGTHTLREVAAMVPCSYATVWRHVQAGHLTAHRLGPNSPWYVRDEDFREWVDMPNGAPRR